MIHKANDISIDAVSIQGLRFAYPGGGGASGEIDLRLQRGRTLALLGPSDCGKTTLLRLIAGLLAPTQGRISFSGAPVAQLGLTALYVTHDQSESLSLAHDVAVMRGGKIEQLAPPEALVGQPASAHVAEFLRLGAVVAVTRENGAWRLAGTDIRLPDPPIAAPQRVLLAYACILLPQPVRYASAALAQIGDNLEAAARVSSANAFIAFRRIVLPLIASSVVTAMLLVFAVATRELVASTLVAPIGTQTVATFIWKQFDQGSVGLGMAMAFVAIVLTTIIPLIVIGLLGRRETLAGKSA